MHDTGEVYYIVLRGNGRAPMFVENDDYLRFERHVADAVSSCQASVHAYCWAPTEARLAVRIASMPIGQFAQRLADQHMRRSDRELSLTGSHFEQKYRGVLIDGHTALLELVRHIHLAPVKAGLTDDPANYRWSSHRAYLGLETVAWLTMQDVFASLETSGPDTRSAYCRFMQHGLERAASPGSEPGEAIGKI